MFVLQLLVGIKDTNDQLVAATLRSLADLVPILGSSTVIGGQRAKLFNDGRPTLHPVKHLKRRSIPQNHVSALAAAVDPSSSGVSAESNQFLELPERPQPDGEEVDTSTEDIEQSADDDLEAWDDWDTNEHGSGNPHQSSAELVEINSGSELSMTNSLEVNETNGTSSLRSLSLTDSGSHTLRKKSLPDILDLDIKNQRNAMNGADDMNFFQDMEPVIDSSAKYLVVNDNDNDDGLSDKTKVVQKLDLSAVASESNEEGWGDEDWD